jgi:hypothetical protein
MRVVDFVTDPGSDDSMDLASTRSALTTVRGGWRLTIVSVFCARTAAN